jgi:hypothetical protein
MKKLVKRKNFFIEEALKEYYGIKCEDFEENCACCQAWKEYDSLVKYDVVEEDGPATCAICGFPMPKGEEMFNFHGFSGPCPKE